MKTTTILFTGPDHWIDGEPLTPGVIYIVPADVADALIALGKATADTGLKIDSAAADGNARPASKKKRVQFAFEPGAAHEPDGKGGAQ